MKIAAQASDWLTLFTSSLKPLNSIQPKLDRKQNLKVLYVFGIFLANLLAKVAYCTQVHDMWPFGPLVYKQCLKVIFIHVLYMAISNFYGLMCTGTN